MFTFDIEGLPELEAEWKAGCDQLDRDLEAGSLIAAKDGVEAAQKDHPYTDRTGDLTSSAHADPRSKGAAMTWPMPYAGFVDKGTSRSKPYPFTPEAERVARRSLELRATVAADDLAKKMNR